MPESCHKRSSRSLNALAHDFQPTTETERFHRRSLSHGLHPADPNYQAALQGNGNGSIAASGAYDPFVASNPLSAAGAVGSVPANPYSHDTAAALGGAAFFGNQTGFQQPVSLSTLCFKPGLTSSRSSTICMPQSALITRTLWDTNAMSTTSFFPMTFARSCRRRQRLLCRHCRVCQFHEHDPAMRLTFFRHSIARPGRLLSLPSPARPQPPEECRDVRLPKLGVQGAVEQGWKFLRSSEA